MAYRSNNEHTVTTGAGQFLLTQRNAGYVDNDGQWVVSQLPELYWSPIGVLRQRRPGTFLGVFATLDAANAAITAAEPQPIVDEMLMSMGTVSC